MVFSFPLLSMPPVRGSSLSPAANPCHNASCTAWLSCSPRAVARALIACYSTTVQRGKTNSTFVLVARERTARRLYHTPAATPLNLHGLHPVPEGGLASGRWGGTIHGWHYGSGERGQGTAWAGVVRHGSEPILGAAGRSDQRDGGGGRGAAYWGQQ